MAKKAIDDVDVRGKRVLMRSDFNVPLEDGRITDDYRITRALPTIRRVTEGGGMLICMSHLGKPKGERKESLSLRPVAEALSRCLGKSVAFAEDCVGEAAAGKVSQLSDGDILLLENLRFHAEEEIDEEQAQQNENARRQKEQFAR